ncbi:hypothetical protein ACFLSI_02390 [Bacteroidota bacterium]
MILFLSLFPAMENNGINTEVLKKCLDEVGRKSGLGDSQNWTNRDYDQLNILIFEETKIDISISTLIRLFKGNLRFKPHKSTLDAIAKYAGYDSWFQFSLSPEITEINSSSSSSGTKSRKKNLTPVIWIIAVVACTIIAYLLFKNSNTDEIKNIDFKIANPNIIGVPASVEIRYDTKNYKPDSLLLKLYAESREPRLLDPLQKQYNGIYLYPGYHSCQIYADNILVGEEKVFIESDGWLSLIRQDGNQLIPDYINNENSISQGIFQITREMVNEIPVDPNKPIYTSIYYVKDLGGLLSTDYILILRAMAPQSDFVIDPCKYCTIFLIGEKGKHSFTFGDYGCSPCFNMQFSDTLMNGNYTSLSEFECDFSEWQSLTSTVSDNTIIISIGETEVYKSEELRDIGKILGVHFLFYGLGALDYVKLTNSDGLLAIDEDFN